jgi:hypothetical protein
MRKYVVQKWFSTVSLVFLFAVGLGLGWSLRAEARRPRARGKAPAAQSAVDCKVDRDCVVVVDDCCPCSQGGKQRAIPRKGKDAYEKDRKKRCQGTMCTEMMSEDPSCKEVPFCGAGICELRAP